MAKPKITLTANFGVAYPALDYTALTGGTMDWNTSPTAWGKQSPNGWDGSCWWIGAPKGDGSPGKWKAGTGDLLKPTMIGTLVSVSGSGIGGATWICDLFDTPDTSGGYQDTSGQWNFSSDPAGLRHFAEADQRERTLHYYTQTYGSGWQVEASLTDGSVILQTLALPTPDFVASHFTVVWIAGSTCQLQLDIVRRASGAGGIQCPACYQDKPRLIPRQRY